MNISNTPNSDLSPDAVMECYEEFRQEFSLLPGDNESSSDQLQKIENQKDLFIATLAHDLKNPLQAQLSGLKMLVCGLFGKLSSEQVEILSMIIESSEFMQEILSTLLTTYKYENGVIRLKLKKFNFIQMVKKCIKEFSALAKENCINIEFEYFPNVQYICGDESQIRRVITNLISNSVNYAYKSTKIFISIQIEDENLVFSIKNSSPIIPLDVQQTLFDKYTVGINFKKQTGTGLGLYFCKQAIEAHGGSIYLSSSGTDNAFIFRIPIQPEMVMKNRIIWFAS